MTTRFTLALLAAGVAAGAARPQEPESEGPRTPVTKFAVRPAAPPVPALKYRLLPELRDTTPGNAALLYYRAFSPEWWGFYKRDPKIAEALDEAQSKPLAELKSPDQATVGWVRGVAMLKEVDRAARRSHCDWELTARVREDGISLLLPDAQSMRDYARMLAVRARLELAAGDFDAAAHTFQTSLQMSRHIGDAPTLIQSLIGVATASVTLGQVEEFIRTPGSPNLYWSLTHLPEPFISLRTPMQGERMLLDNLLPGFREALRDPATPPLSAERVRELGQTLARAADVHRGDAAWVMIGLAAKKYPAAKEFLRAHGRTDEQIAALPVLQAVLLYETAIYDRFFDDMLKWQGQPYWVVRPALDREVHKLKAEVTRSGSPGLSLAGLLLPAVEKVCNATVRVDRRIQALRCVEALRLYAAAHGGRLPPRLDAITEVPVPTDPMTGRPFEYELKGETAILTGPPPTKGDPADERNSFRFEITIAN